MRLTRNRYRIPIRIDCTCHDPTVFGHLTCTRAETQPNNTPPQMPPTTTTRINAGTLTGATITCPSVTYDEISLIGQHMNQLNATTRETAQYVEDLATILYDVEMHYHENLEDMSACPRCAPRHG